MRQIGYVIAGWKLGSRGPAIGTRLVSVSTLFFGQASTRRMDAGEQRTDPFETLVETVSRGGTSGLDVPSPLSERVKAELVGDLGSVHGVWQIL